MKCPHCGYCQHRGRSNETAPHGPPLYPQPLYPWPWNPPVYPPVIRTDPVWHSNEIWYQGTVTGLMPHNGGGGTWQ